MRFLLSGFNSPKAINKLTQSTAINVPMNKDADDIFNDDLEEEVNKFLSWKVSKDSVAQYAFAQSVHNHKVAKEKGASAVRHCTLMIQLGCLVHETMGYKGGLYDLVAKICGLPCDRSIRKYNVSSSNDEDGFMQANVERARHQFDQKNPNAPRFAFSQHITVAFDGMHTKGRFEVNHHTNELIGVADDAFEENVIMAELNQLEKTASVDDDANIVLPEIAKHFLVFIATTWQSDQKHQFLVGRYALQTINQQRRNGN